MELKRSKDQISVFISYAREDEEFANILKKSLENHGFKVWIDTGNIMPTENWKKAIRKGIRESDYFINLASKASFDSKEVKVENTIAKELNKIIVPISIDPELEWLPEQISDIHWIDFSAIIKQKIDSSFQLVIYSEEYNKLFNELITVFETDVEWVKLFTRLQQKTWEWKDAGHNKSFLLIDDELQLFLDSINRYEGKKPELTADQKDFIENSIKYGDEQFRRKIRNKRILLSMLSVLMIAIIATGILAILNRTKNIDRLALNLAKTSTTILNQPRLSLLLSIIANEISNGSEVEASLYSSIMDNIYLADTLELPPESQIAIAKDAMVITYCVDQKWGYCMASELRLINLESLLDEIEPLFIKGQVFFPIINDDQNYFGVIIYDDPDTFVNVYNRQKDEIILEFSKKTDALSISFGFEDNEIIVGSTGLASGKIEFWDIKTGNYTKPPISFGDTPVSSFDVDDGSLSLYFVNLFGLNKWDAMNASHYPVSFSGMFHQYHLESGMSFTPNLVRMVRSDDGNYIATKDGSKIITWDTKTQSSIDYISIDSINVSPFHVGMEFIPGTSELMFLSGNELFIYNVNEKTTTTSINITDVIGINISIDGRFYILSFSNGNISIYDTWRKNQLFIRETEINPKNYLYSLSLNDEYIIIQDFYGDDDNELTLFNHDLIELGKISEKCNYSANLAQNLPLIALGCYDGTIQIYNIEDKKIIHEFRQGDGLGVEKTIFSPDGNSLYSFLGIGRIYKYDLINQKIVWKLNIDIEANILLRGPEISPDGKFIVLPVIINSSDEIFLIDINSEDPKIIYPNEIINYLALYSMVTGGNFSPNSELVTFNTFNQVILYNPTEDRVLQVISTDAKVINHSAFLDENTLILATGRGKQSTSQNTGKLQNEDQCLEIWNITDGVRIGLIHNAHNGTINSIKPISDDTFLTSSHDGTIKVWDVSYQHLKRYACELSGRDLTTVEWRNYIGKIISQVKICPSGLSPFVLDLKQRSYPINFYGNMMGKPSGSDVNHIATFNPNKQLENNYELITEIRNKTSHLVVEEPAIIQCRDKSKSWVFLPEYVLVWPIHLIGNGFFNYIGTNNTENSMIRGSFLQPDGSLDYFELAGILNYGKIDILAPKEHIKYKVIQGSGKNINTIILEVDDIPNYIEAIGPDEEKFSLITIENPITKSHFNLLEDDMNFPMHSLIFSLNNLSEFDVDSVLYSAIVYNNNGEVIDLMMGSFEEEDSPLIESKGSRRLWMTSFSLSGRCVGDANNQEDISIRLWLSLVVSLDNKPIGYKTIYEVLYSGE